jgi:hypothetical protein
MRLWMSRRPLVRQRPEPLCERGSARRHPAAFGIRIVYAMTAKELAERATNLAEKLKPGTWEAVQALALASIAQSLATMSEHRDDT